MTEYAVVIPVNGEAHSIEWPSDDQGHLSTLYEAIGCRTVELVRLPHIGLSMWADDEGLFVADPETNVLASLIAEQPIVGTVVLTPWSDGPDSPGYTQSEAFNLVYGIKRSQNV